MDHSASPSSSATSPGTAKSVDSSPTSNSLAFLVHSPETVQRNLPPDVDNKPLARQKRRRTSKEDEDILKAEYQRNPKPDKAARLEIVRKVALGEKEVQIWFQNKRQNDRRRSRPAQSFDVYPPPQSSQETCINTISVAPFESPSNSQGLDQTEQRTEERIDSTVSVQNAPSGNATASQNNDASSPTALTRVGMAAAPVEIKPDSQSTASLSHGWTATDPQSQDTVATELSSSQPFNPSQEGNTQPVPRPGYLANRRSASFKLMEEEIVVEKPTDAMVMEQAEESSRSLRRTHSYVRLSMTADGKAKVVTDADQSPSPPRSQPQPSRPAGRTAGLRRSYSAAGLNERLMQASTLEPLRKMQRTSTIGRSRDSRAWEFWCDSEARNSLAEKADQEGSGSAADAIGLIRANSRGALRSNPNKRNTQLQRSATATRSKGDMATPQKPNLARSSTSQGRLQGKAMLHAKPSETPRQPGKDKNKDADIEEYEIPNTESDKENWEPLNQDVGNRRRRLPPSTPNTHRPRQILGENTDILSQSSSLGAMMARERRQKGGPNHVDENVNPEDDAEIASFMGSSRPGAGRSAVSSGEELGCVEGLLALSQGNWR